MAYKRSKFWTNSPRSRGMLSFRFSWHGAAQLVISAAAIGFLASTVLFYGLVDRLTARQQRLEQMVSAVAPLRAMQAMAARFEHQKWDAVSAAMLVAKIYQRAKELNIDPLLIEAMIIIESACDTNAVSPKGARGLMQLMPEHLAPGEDPHEPILNIEKGTAYYAQCRKRSRGNIEHALYRYNAGINSDPRKNLAESVDFVKKVLGKYEELKGVKDSRGQGV